jgi:transcriptional regulator with XRE-family HTH domain
MDDWDRLKEKLLEDPATRVAYESRRPAYELASKLIQVRSCLGLSQRQLAAKAHMTQPEISRLESGTVQPTWETISRVLRAVGAEVEIKLRDRDGKVVSLSVLASEPQTEPRPTSAAIGKRETAGRARRAIVDP